MQGERYELSELASEQVGETGVAHGAELVAFAEAVVRDQPEKIASARDRLLPRLGVEATVDAAAVVAAFHVVTRIADATGIQLDRDMYEQTADLRAEMGLERIEKRGRVA